MHADALGEEDRVLVVDDLLATGGTAAATVEMIRSVGARVEAVCFVIELDFLEGRSKLDGVSVNSLVHF